MSKLNREVTYHLNPLIRGTWEGKSGFILQNILTKKKYTFSHPIFSLLLYCSKTRSYNQLVDHISDDLAINKSEARAILNNLINIGVLDKSNQETFNIWFDRNWRNALYFHLLTSDNDFIDKGQENEEEIKSNVLSTYLKQSPLPSFYKKYKKNTKSIRLPRPFMESTSVDDILFRRRTTRKFSEKPISLKQLSTILYYSCQPLKLVRDYAMLKRREHPIILVLSSYTPFEVYFYANNVTNLTKGLYHYNMRTHSISLLKKGVYNKEMKKIAIGQGVENASVVFLISSIFERYMWRYRNSRAYRNLLIECSSLAQRIILVTVAVNLRQFLTPAIRDSRADNLFGLDGYSEAFNYLIAVGN